MTKKLRNRRPVASSKPTVKIFVPPPKDELPPHSMEAERGALGCILLAGTIEGKGSLNEVDALLTQLRPKDFFDLRHRNLFEEIVKLRMEGHACDMPCLLNWLKGQKKMEDVGGLMYLTPMPDSTPGIGNFSFYREILKEKTHRRALAVAAHEMKTRAYAETISMEDTHTRLGELFDATADKTGQAMIEIITPKEARAYIADQSDFLIGQGLISLDQFITIGGVAGCGKSRLATTLAVAGARGKGTWMGYPVRSQFRTLILQTENKNTRLKEEFDAVPAQFDDYIRVSKNLPNGLAFSNHEFRRQLQRIHDQWPFQLLVVDPWNDVSSDDGQSDYKESLLNIQSCFRGKKMPATAIVAHLRKPRADASGQRKSGRELLHELSGSLALGSTSRTVFAVQPASHQMEDDRIVFEVAKANDVNPAWLAEFGTRSAWHRMNGTFEPAQEFDWESWSNPESKNEERQKVTLEILTTAFGKRAGMKGSELVRAIVSAAADANEKIGQSTAWRAIGESGYLRKYMHEVAGVFALLKK